MQIRNHFYEIIPWKKSIDRIMVLIIILCDAFCTVSPGREFIDSIPMAGLCQVLNSSRVCSISGDNLVDHRKQEKIVMFGGRFPAAKHNITPSFKWNCPPRWNASIQIQPLPYLSDSLINLLILIFVNHMTLSVHFEAMECE
jgi:hypothetical protein